ncbi:MAG: hypothetical protein WAQ07_02350 [Candidatus Omnitrophota bacterium]
MVRNSKGSLLIIVLATVLIVFIFSLLILSIISSQSRLTHHQVSRIKAYYAGRGMMNYALERLRSGAWSLPPTGSRYYACHRALGSPKACVDSVTPRYTITTDSSIPYNIQIAIYHNGTGPGGVGSKLEIKTEYQ